MTDWPIRLDPIEMYRGDPEQLRFEFYQSDGTTPADLSGFDAGEWHAQVRRTPNGSLITELILDVTGLAVGVILADIEPAGWANMLKFPTAVFDIQSGPVGDPVKTVLAGSFATDMDVTHG